MVFDCHVLIGRLRIDDYADEETGDERFSLLRRKRVREESSNGTVILALECSDFVSITLLRI